MTFLHMYIMHFYHIKFQLLSLVSLLPPLAPSFFPARSLYTFVSFLLFGPVGFIGLLIEAWTRGYSQNHGRLTRCYTTEENESPSSRNH